MADHGRPLALTDPWRPPCAWPLCVQEASKARENRLRKAGIQARARFAAELRGMDSDVAALSKALAVGGGLLLLL